MGVKIYLTTTCLPNYTMSTQLYHVYPTIPCLPNYPLSTQLPPVYPTTPCLPPTPSLHLYHYRLLTPLFLPHTLQPTIVPPTPWTVIKYVCRICGVGETNVSIVILLYALLSTSFIFLRCSFYRIPVKLFFTKNTIPPPL